MLCTRFNGLRPLLELEKSNEIKLEFRTQNQHPYTPIENEVDLVSAFYTANEITEACLTVKISMSEELKERLDAYGATRQSRIDKISSPKASPLSRRKSRNIFGKSRSPQRSQKDGSATAESSKENNSSSSSGIIKLQRTEILASDQEPRQSWGLHPFSQKSLN